MRIQATLGVLGTALVTCALVLAIAGTRNVGAVDASDSTIAAVGVKGEAPAIPHMEMDTAGCRIEVSTDKTEYQPGDSPILTITAKNPGSQPVETSIQLQILAASIPSPFARVMPQAQSVWAGDCLVQLGPGETRSFVVKSDAQLAAGQLLTMAMTSGDQKAQAGGVKVAGGEQPSDGMPQPTTTQAASRT